MRTSVIESPLRIVIKDTELPQIGPEEVLVKLDGTGVCASNLPVWEGREWFSYPFEAGAPGHEGYGIVASKGSNVTGLKEGDRVALISYHAYAEYDKAHMSNVVKIPEPLHSKAFPGEPAACAVNVFKRSEILPGQDVLVIGAGYLGCLLIQLIQGTGASVTVVSRRNTSLKYAEMAGADHLVSFGDYYRTLDLLRKKNPSGFPRVIEATGAQAAIDLASEVIMNRGRLIIAGYHQDGIRNINMQLWNWKGIDVINAHERDPRVYIDGMNEAVELTGKGVLDPQKYITHFIEFKEINEAFRLLKDRPENFLKAVITYQ